MTVNEDKIIISANRLNLLFSEEADIPTRLKKSTNNSLKNQKINTESSIEKRFQENVNHWLRIIRIMLDKIDNSTAWRFINIQPMVLPNTNRVVDCKDFCDFLDYLVLRRDKENCDDDELGRLAQWSTYFQYKIEDQIKKMTEPEVEKIINNEGMNFITIDFETATSDRHSPCELGLTFVENNKIIETKSWLIKPFSYPHFDSFNIMIHGITPDDVKDKPEFPEIWNEIKGLIENKFLIAHNAGFDMSVLRRTLDYYNIPYPTLKYSCSYIFSKKVWVGLPSYDLKTLCKIKNINLKHHRAGNDSKATAELTILALNDSGTKSIDEFPDKLKTTIGELYVGGYQSSITKRIYKPKNLSLILGDTSKNNPDSIFYGRTVVFTGTLSSMQRAQAQQIIADIGGINSPSVTRDTDYLIVGHQDYRIVGEDGMSSKQEKAIKLIEKGSELEILSEEDFLKNI